MGKTAENAPLRRIVNIILRREEVMITVHLSIDDYNKNSLPEQFPISTYRTTRAIGLSGRWRKSELIRQPRTPQRHLHFCKIFAPESIDNLRLDHVLSLATFNQISLFV